MRHPTDGALRRLVDEPAAVAEADHDHVAQCPICHSLLAAARDDAAFAGAALGGSRPDGVVDLDDAWQRLTQRLAADVPRRAQVARPARRWRGALRRPAVATVGVAAILTGAGVAAAADWLPIFHTERIAPIVIGPGDLVQLPDLSSYGELEIVDEVELREVPNAAAAEQATGLTAPAVERLPRGVVGEPTFHVGNHATAEFTFSAERAAAAAAAAGETLAPPPPGLDGRPLRLVAGPGLAAVWEEARGVPALIVARGGAPTGYSTGIPFATARDYLVSLPGMPEDVAAQLRRFSADGSTLPVPIGDPSGEVATSDTDVNGVPATVVELSDGVLTAVMWVDDGVVHLVGGSLSADEVLDVARGLG